MESNNEEEEEEQVCYKLVPWISWEEWNFVRESLFSTCPDSISTALTRISTWRIRGCLPTIIEVTAAIIEAQQKDPFFREDLNSDAMESEVILAMLHSMAIMRLVNGVAHKGRYETEGSIADKALEIGLPRMLVDLRHEASHRDLPSLRLVQLASVKALEWVKSYYWERQKNAILSQRDTIDFVRKKVKSKLHELAFYLNTNESSQLGSLPMKRKRSKQSSVILARFNLFSHTVKKLHGSQSQGPKKHITRILRKLFQLYTSSPSEVVAVLLDLLVKTFDSSNVVEPLHDSGVEQISGDSRTQTGLTNLFKLVITRLSSREPDLILIMLQAVFQTLERRDTMKYEIDKESLSCSQSKAEDLQIEQLSSLVLWLIEDYKRVKQHASSIVRGNEIHNSSVDMNVVPKVTLAEILKKCLLYSPGNRQLARSAMLLAQIIGSSSMVERLKKLPSLSLPNLDSAEQSSVRVDTAHFINQQNSSICQAAEMLKFFKQRWNKGKAASMVASSADINSEGRWKVAKAWNPCPIGMLPCALGSTGVLPVLDRVVILPEVQKLPGGKESWEWNTCSGMTYDVGLLEKTNAIEERNAVEDGQADDPDLLLNPVKGQLMIGGVYKKVWAEELLAIESAVRILV